MEASLVARLEQAVERLERLGVRRLAFRAGSCRSLRYGAPLHCIRIKAAIQRICLLHHVQVATPGRAVGGAAPAAPAAAAATPAAPTSAAPSAAAPSAGGSPAATIAEWDQLIAEHLSPVIGLSQHLAPEVGRPAGGSAWGRGTLLMGSRLGLSVTAPLQKCKFTNLYSWIDATAAVHRGVAARLPKGLASRQPLGPQHHTATGPFQL